MPALVRPSERYRGSYIAAVREFQAEGRWLHLSTEQLEGDFGSYVRDLLRRSDRATQDPELVPETFWWLVEDDEFVGVVSVRHELNENLLKVGGHIGYAIRPSKRRMGCGKLILKLVLEKAKELGIRKALITCDSDNIGSKKIIEANGGVLENEVEADIDGRRVKKLRYWIDIG